MANMAGAQEPSVVRKEKKKQVKDELDRVKQAEKKKRRLEKALATSAAIRSELEKKKQKKKEEQQRLDEEGAAIAEAVALQVLLGEESDETCKIVLQKDEGFNPWGHASNIGVFMGGWRADLPQQCFTRYSLEGKGWICDAYGFGCKGNDWGISSWSFSPAVPEGNGSCFEERSRGTTDFLAGHIAAQAVSTLQIAEDANVDNIVNGLFRG